MKILKILLSISCLFAVLLFTVQATAAPHCNGMARKSIVHTVSCTAMFAVSLGNGIHETVTQAIPPSPIVTYYDYFCLCVDQEDMDIWVCEFTKEANIQGSDNCIDDAWCSFKDAQSPGRGCIDEGCSAR
jgi:hypothetical protein